MINTIFTTQELRSKWEEWLQYRKERKLPKYVPTGLKQTITHLELITGGDQKKAIEFIDYSMAQNFQGIYPKPNYESRTSKDNRKPGTSEARIEGLINLR